MLRDSANIQMSEAEWKSRKSLRNGGPEVEPLYDLEDVAGLMGCMIPCPSPTRTRTARASVSRKPSSCPCA